MPEFTVRRPTALGVHIFAGGFTAGVRRAGFDVLAHLEDGAYGVESARRNFPGLDVRVGDDSWREEEFAGRVDLLFSNPPCAIFSSAGISTTREAGAWRSDPRLSCWHRAWRVFEAVRPAVFALESVCQAYTKGREVVDDWTRRALAAGYSVIHLLEDGIWCGLPQSRRRFFFLACRKHLPLDFRFDFASPRTVGSVLADVRDPGEVVDHCRGKNGGRYWQTVCATPQGQGLAETFDGLGFGTERGPRGEVVGRPGFMYQRLRCDGTMGAFTGDFFVHPTEDRFLGFNEQKAICGYPPDFWLEGKPQGWGSMLARAVMPPVGEWLARSVAAVLRVPARDWCVPSVTLIDIRKAPGSRRDLTQVYAPETGARELALLDYSCQVRSCDDCPRMAGRDRIMFQSNGPAAARVMFVGEAPGRSEVGRTGLPMHGDATGVNFDALLRAAGLSRNLVFVTNAILCNPPAASGKNGEPLASEVENCSRHLADAISLVDPCVVATLGSSALSAVGILEDHGLVLRRDVGRARPWMGRMLVPLYHPGPRAMTVRTMEQQRADFESLGRLVEAAAAAVGQVQRRRTAVPLTVAVGQRETQSAPDPPAPAVAASSRESPEAGEGSGAFIRRLWMTGRHSPEQLVSMVHANWAGRTTKVSDVYYNYRRLLDSGIGGVPPWPSKNSKAAAAAPAATAPVEARLPRAAPGQSRGPSLLLVGSTPIQCGSDRTVLKILTAARCWAAAFRQAGHLVDWRSVVPGEDVSGYDRVVVILNKPNSIASNNVHGALWVLSQRPDAVLAADDWQTAELTSGLRVCAKVRERLFRLEKRWRRRRPDSPGAWDPNSQVGDAVYDACCRLAGGDWDRPVLVPILGEGDVGVLGLPAARIVAADPTAFAPRYELPEGPRPARERRWIKASLLQKPVPEGLSWPVIEYGNCDRSGGRGKIGSKAQPRVTESELFGIYLSSWGVMSPAHPHSGSGWWRARYLMAADAGCILSAEAREAACLGSPYSEASDPRAVERLSGPGLSTVAAEQRRRLAEVSWPRDRVLEVLESLFSGKAVTS